jgi:hypothetical protein
MMQAFDAPWPIIQANAIYLVSCLVSLSDDQRILALYQTQVLFNESSSLTFFLKDKKVLSAHKKILSSYRCLVR